MDRQGMAVCRDCLIVLRQPKPASQWRKAAPPIRPWMGRSFTTAAPTRRRHEAPTARKEPPQPRRVFSTTSRRPRNAKPSELSNIHTRVFELSNTATQLSENQLPSEQRILYVLEQLDAIAKTLTDAQTVAGAKAARESSNNSDTTADTTATSALLGSVNARQYPAFLSKASLLNLISEKAEEIMRHPYIFITPTILKTYIDLQAHLHQPSSFPDIFELYASKPAPRLGKTGGGHTANITYATPNPDKINAAVPVPTANTALNAAISAHNLPLALDIINTTFSTPAFRKSKILRQAFLPFSGLLLAPAGAYVLSHQFSLYQTTMTTSYATGVAFAGIMTYVATVSGLGYVVITTANDQMERVTWARGVPLWERWVREEERAALDKVACAWGFRDVRRRGEEEGVEWDGLREEVGRRGMGLDRVELMEGME